MNSRRFLRQTTAAEATLAQQKSIKLSHGIKEGNSLIYQFVIFDGLRAFKTCVDLPPVVGNLFVRFSLKR